MARSAHQSPARRALWDNAAASRRAPLGSARGRRCAAAPLCPVVAPTTRVSDALPPAGIAVGGTLPACGAAMCLGRRGTGMAFGLGPRANRVYESLRGSIAGGELPPGTKLPAHTELAQQYGV